MGRADPLISAHGTVTAAHSTRIVSAISAIRRGSLMNVRLAGPIARVAPAQAMSSVPIAVPRRKGAESLARRSAPNTDRAARCGFP